MSGTVVADPLVEQAKAIEHPKPNLTASGLWGLEYGGKSFQVTQEQLDQIRAAFAKEMRRGLNRANIVIEGGIYGHRDMIKIHEDQFIVSRVSDVMGGVTLPDLSIWDPAYQAMWRAQADLKTSKFEDSARATEEAQLHARAAMAAFTAYREGTITGAGRSVTGLEWTRDISFAVAGIIATVATGGAGGILIGTAMGAAGTTAQQAMEVHLDMRREIDWRGIGLDAAIGVILAVLGGKIAGKILRTPAAASLGRVIVERIVRNLLMGRAQSIVHQTLRTLIDNLSGEKDAMTGHQLAEALANQLTDPKSYFMDFLNGELSERVHIAATKFQAKQGGGGGSSTGKVPPSQEKQQTPPSQEQVTPEQKQPPAQTEQAAPSQEKTAPRAETTPKAPPPAETTPVPEPLSSQPEPLATKDWPAGPEAATKPVPTSEAVAGTEPTAPAAAPEPTSAEPKPAAAPAPEPTAEAPAATKAKKPTVAEAEPEPGKEAAPAKPAPTPVEVKRIKARALALKRIKKLPEAERKLLTDALERMPADQAEDFLTKLGTVKSPKKLLEGLTKRVAPPEPEEETGLLAEDETRKGRTPVPEDETQAPPEHEEDPLQDLRIKKAKVSPPRISPDRPGGDRSELRENLKNSKDLPDWAKANPDTWEAHHVIPVGEAGHEVLEVLRNKGGGWDMNSPDNGIALPKEPNTPGAGKLPVHQVTGELITEKRAEINAERAKRGQPPVPEPDPQTKVDVRGHAVTSKKVSAELDKLGKAKLSDLGIPSADPDALLIDHPKELAEEVRKLQNRLKAEMEEGKFVAQF